MGVFRDLSPKTQEVLAELAQVADLARGDHLFHDKGAMAFIYWVLEGNFTIYKLSSKGDKKVIFVMGPGACLNEEALLGLPASVSCQAFSKARVLAIPLEGMTCLIREDFGLAKLVFDSLAKKNRRLYRQLKNTSGSIRMDKKLAAKLWKLSLDHGVPHEDGVMIDLKLPRTYLADLLGSQRETVSRSLGDLAEQKLVEIKGQYIIVRDRKALQNFFKDRD